MSFSWTPIANIVTITNIAFIKDIEYMFFAERAKKIKISWEHLCPVNWFLFIPIASKKASNFTKKPLFSILLLFSMENNRLGHLLSNFIILCFFQLFGCDNLKIIDVNLVFILLFIFLFLFSFIAHFDVFLFLLFCN